jgi:hypothetical protein
MSRVLIKHICNFFGFLGDSGIGLFAGSICGLLLRCSCFERTVRLFNDAEYFEVPHDDGTGLSVR